MLCCASIAQTDWREHREKNGLRRQAVSGLVWVSRALVHASNQRPFRNDIAEKDHDRLIEIQKANEQGEILDPADFPRVIFGAPHALDKDYNLPDLFAAYGYWVVSRAAVDVLQQFDLGQAQFVPVPVLKNDLQTPVGGEWFCINFGNAKNTIIPEKSEKLRPWPQNRFKLPATIADNQLAVSSEALWSPDIWVDPRLRGACS
jgi:hypothetical protein